MFSYLQIPGRLAQYQITAKLEGVRRLYIHSVHGQFLVDRAHQVVRLAALEQPETETADGCHSVLDGEYMADGHLYIFDALVVRGQVLLDRPFRERYAHAAAFVANHTSTTLHMKRFYPIVDCRALLDACHLDAHVLRVDAEAVSVAGAGAGAGTGVRALADGLILMDQEAPYLTTSPFALLKWKCAHTVDVLVDLRMLCTRDGVPHRASRVRTYYWEYSVFHGRSRPVFFASCRTTTAQRRLLWKAARAHGTQYVLCVECAHGPGGWTIVRPRLDKTRSNAARTVRDTLQLVAEALSFQDLRELLLRRASDDHDEQVEPSLQAWAGHAWTRSAAPCELEVRLLHQGTTALPVAVFDAIVARLSRTMCATETSRVDYASGEVRATIGGAAIHKEELARHDWSVAHLAPLSFRCVLSLEHLVPTPLLREWTHRRHKRQWRFVTQNIAIECSRVYATDIQAPDTMVLSYEVELELVSSRTMAQWSHQACRTLVQSLVQTLLGTVLGEAHTHTK